MLITEDLDDVAVLRIEHGKVGALDAELLDALTEAVTASDRALVLTPVAGHPRRYRRLITHIRRVT